MIGNKRLTRYEKIISFEKIDFLLYAKQKTKKNSSPWKINVKFCIFPNHGSGEIFPVMNDLMICKCIRNECLNKGPVVQQHRSICGKTERSVRFIQKVQ